MFVKVAALLAQNILNDTSQDVLRQIRRICERETVRMKERNLREPCRITHPGCAKFMGLLSCIEKVIEEPRCEWIPSLRLSSWKVHRRTQVQVHPTLAAFDAKRLGATNFARPQVVCNVKVNFISCARQRHDQLQASHRDAHRYRG